MPYGPSVELQLSIRNILISILGLSLFEENVLRSSVIVDSNAAVMSHTHRIYDTKSKSLVG